MTKNIGFKIQPQPTETTCGAACLHSVYGYYGDHLPMIEVIDEVKHLKSGGTISAFLGSHALKRGYDARIYTYNLQVFDPTWFTKKMDLTERLRAQAEKKHDGKLKEATAGYIEFLSLGGEIRFKDLNASLITKYLSRKVPIITGLSATYLYRDPREIGVDGKEDDICGEPAGHFVVLCGYDGAERKVLVADPLKTNPLAADNVYHVDKDRVLCSVLLGVITYDANLLIITPQVRSKGKSGGGPTNSK